MASVDNRPLGQQTLRGFGIFQAIVSIPTMVILGFFAWEQMVFPYREDFYSFLWVLLALCCNMRVLRRLTVSKVHPQ
jgi:hypothetical protein